jgi:hypothetical protein
LQVAKRFLAAVKECSGPGLNMAFFISYSPEDIIRQAEESTLRYQRGKKKEHSFTLTCKLQLAVTVSEARAMHGSCNYHQQKQQHTGMA